MTDTEGLINRYLDDELFQAYESAYRDSKAGALAPPSSDWKLFEPEGAGFRVLMPGTPKLSRRALGGAGSGLPDQIHMSAYQGAGYGVGVREPAGVKKITLDSARDAHLAATPGARLLQQRDVTLDNVHGLDLRLALSDPTRQATEMIERLRLFVTGNGRIFALLYVGPKENADSKEAATFFNSFHITTGK